MDATNGRRMSRDEMTHHLRAERLGLRQRRLALRKQRTAVQHELDAIEERLDQIRHAFGLLGATDEVDL